jgi:hypothetical protein
MSPYPLVCGCAVHVDSVGVTVEWCRVHAQAHRLLAVLVLLARGSRVTARDVEDVLADAGVSLLDPSRVGDSIGRTVGLERALDLHRQSLTALLLDPAGGASAWDERTARARVNARVELYREIAALEALKKAGEGDAVVSARGDQRVEVARG